MFGVLPYVAININNYFNIPVYDHLYLKIVGIIFGFAGLAVVIHCTYILFLKPEQYIIPVPNQAPEKLIISGLYKYVRHPMYIGYLFIALSEFLILGHPLILAYILGAIPLVNILVIKEEKTLERKFGKEYIQYKKRVPRWIPRFHRKAFL